MLPPDLSRFSGKITLNLTIPWAGIGMAVLLWMVLILGGILIAPAGTWASSTADQVLMQRVLQNLSQENYEEALRDLTRAWQQGPQTAEKAYLFGRIYRQMMEYKEAQQYLEEALRLQPVFPEAQLMLADTLIGLNQPEKAVPVLEQLQASGYEPGQTAFLQGMAAYKQKQFSRAVEYFRQAQQEPKLAQEAKFQESLALAAQNRLTEARKAMEATVNLNPDSQLAGLAQGYVTAMDVRLKDVRRFRFYGALGFDYDSNVTLQPGGPTAAQFVSGKSDWFYSQSATLEYNVIPSGPFALWGQYTYYQNFHFKIGSYDLWSNTVGLTPAYTWPNSRLWVPFVFNYSDVGSSKYFTSYNLNPTYLYLITSKVGVEAGLRLARNYYWFPVFLPQDDRSGRAIAGSLALYYFLKNQEGYLQARFSYSHDFTSGSNWENNNYLLSLSALYPVTKGLRLRAFADLNFQPYLYNWYNGNPAESNPKRHDTIFIGGVEATQRIYKGLEFNVHYYYIRDKSNISLYNYSRHLVGCQVGYRY